MATPGHAPDHMAFLWLNARAVFCGDLMLGGLDTALVAPPEGDLSRYLASLQRLRDLDLATIYPTHGEPFHDAGAALDAYLRHRAERQEAVLRALAGLTLPDRTENLRLLTGPSPAIAQPLQRLGQLMQRQDLLRHPARPERLLPVGLERILAS